MAASAVCQVRLDQIALCRDAGVRRVLSGQLLAEHDIMFRPAVNEELAATAVQGTQLVAGHEDARVAGITGFWYGKSPGVDRASDALRHANLIGAWSRATPGG